MSKKQKSKKINKKNKNRIDENEFWVNKKSFGYNHPAIINIFKFVVLCVIIYGIIYFAICAETILYCDELKIAEDDLIIKFENSTVYDIDGNYLATLSSGTKRKCISLADMSEYLPKAYIAIEDERYYEHFGVDIKRTAAATVSYIINFGKSDFGGSTITQQVVKNITQDKEDSADRKVKEMAKAIQVEHYLDKEQILELYLNIIFIGGNDINGVELGAKYYFNKTAKELSISECAFMAGINHAPNAYKPFNSENAEMQAKIKTRTKTVLAKMLELNYINEEQYNQAINEVEIGLNFQRGDTEPTTVISYQTEAALEQIVNQIMEEKNVNKKMAEMLLYSGGYKIYTTQKSSLQEIVESELSNPKYLIHNGAQSSMATFVLIENGTGNVLACGAGIEESKIKTNIGNFNYPTSLKKQTGSSMKPISVVAPCLENGIITAATAFYDGETTFGKYKPKNYYNGYKGAMTMREAIAISSNIPNIKALARLGIDNSIKFCESVGITGLGQEGLALALGGLTHGTTAYNMAGAYSAIANNGVYIQPTFYLRVVDSDDNIYIQCKQLEERSNRVMSEQNAYIEKSILESVVNPGGTATYCAMSGFDVAAKTGTTNSNYDRWLCGFTPYYTAACWFGYEKNSVVYYGSSNPAGLIWSSIMKNIHSGLEGKRFEQPAGIVSATICKATGHTATANCNSTYTEVFREGTIPSPCEGHKYVSICNDTGLLASSTCTNISSVTYPKALDQEQNTPWNTAYAGSNYGPSAYCAGNHNTIPDITVVEEPTPNPDPVPVPEQPASTPDVSASTPDPVPTPAPNPEPVVEVPQNPEPSPAPIPEPEAPSTNLESSAPTPQPVESELPANTEVTQQPAEAQ